MQLMIHEKFHNVVCISNIHGSIKLSTNLGQQDDPLAVWPDDVIHL